jgi:hypothetical protein
MYDR